MCDAKILKCSFALAKGQLSMYISFRNGCICLWKHSPLGRAPGEKHSVRAKDLIKEADWPAGRIRIYSKVTHPLKRRSWHLAIAIVETNCLQKIPRESLLWVSLLELTGHFKRKRRRKSRESMFFLESLILSP